MLYDLAWVIIDRGLISFLASQLSRYIFFPLLIGLGPWELEGRPLVIITSVTYETLIDNMWEFAVATGSLLLQVILTLEILVVRLIQMWVLFVVLLLI
jgi:hypothetical protein